MVAAETPRSTPMYEYTALMPHGALEEVFAHVFFVTGTSRPAFQGTQYQFSRNMTVVREGDSLTLINTVRLDDEGLATLDALGKVAHVVKIGAFHGIDDRFYVDRYQAKQWALPGQEHEGGQATDHALTVGGPMPFADASLFVFETANKPEGILHIDREGGILVSCDSLQNWAEVDQYFDEPTAASMTQTGFIKPANIGPAWRQNTQVQASDFQRLGKVEFRHLLPAHGPPIQGDAKEQLTATFAREFGL